ncbi:MAG TPA: hypothetical protein VMX35_02055 [Acidobacteriota bacterium]|nr:hypothetical protein [Acidobacteriota bacterium]
MGKSLLISQLLLCVLVLLASATRTANVSAESEGIDLSSKNTDKPKIISLVPKSETLRANTDNKLLLVLSFKDEGRNLQGGTLELSMLDSKKNKSELIVDLKSKRYSRSSGKARIKLTLECGQIDWLKVIARLRDTEGNLSRSKKLKMLVEQTEGDIPWGTAVGFRALDFTLLDKDGNEVSLHDYWGSVILLDLAAPG